MHRFEQLTDFIAFLESELLLENGEVNENSELRSLRTWSSLNTLILISRVNDETGILIGAGDLVKCITVMDLFNFLNSK
ncbi:MAG: hypothetical protein M9916_13425 [Crocinitomicaceae bacterium]|nr:hypothetical protein [Crocinitomicaceae bacterium]